MGIRPKMLDPDPELINPDLKHCREQKICADGHGTGGFLTQNAGTGF